MRGRLLLAAALLLVVPDPARPDEEPRALLVFRNGDHRWVFEATAFPFADAGTSAISEALIASLRSRGFLPEADTARRLSGLEFETMGVRGGPVVFPKEWLEALRERRDLEVLVANGGRFPEGYVPAGREKPAEIPPLDFLGAKLVLEIVGGEPRARVTEAPEGSRARKIGLATGDAILEVNGTAVGPAALLLFEERAAAGTQQGLRVRRTHGEIERVVVDSWDRASAGR
jgi:hypothetical protein